MWLTASRVGCLKLFAATLKTAPKSSPTWFCRLLRKGSPPPCGKAWPWSTTTWGKDSWAPCHGWYPRRSADAPGCPRALKLLRSLRPCAAHSGTRGLMKPPLLQARRPPHFPGEAGTLSGCREIPRAKDLEVRDTVFPRGEAGARAQPVSYVRFHPEPAHSRLPLSRAWTADQSGHSGHLHGGKNRPAEGPCVLQRCCCCSAEQGALRALSVDW